MDRGLILICMVYAGSALVLLCAGYASWINGLHRTPQSRCNNRAEGPQIAVLTGATLACFAVAAIYFSEVPGIALVELLSGAPRSRVIQLRSAMTNDFSGLLPYHYYRLAFAVLLPFLLFVWYGVARQRKTLRMYAVFGGFFFATLLLNLADTQKGPAIWILIGLGTTAACGMSRKHRLLLAGAGTVVVAAFTLAAYAVLMSFTDRPLNELVIAVASRVFTGSVAPAYFYLEYYPSLSDFVGINILPNPREILPWTPVAYTVDMANYMSPELPALGVVGSAPTSFWAQLYIAFGLPGLFLGCPLVGVLLGVVQQFLDWFRSPEIRNALTAWAVWHYAQLAVTDINTYLVDEKMALVAAVALALEYAGRRAP